MRTISFFSYCAIIFIATTFTACTEYLSENNNESADRIGLPGRVNVMNENLANAKSRTGSDLLAPAIHTSTVNGSDKPIYFIYTTTSGIQSKPDGDAKTRGSLVTTDNFYNSYCLYTYLYPKIDSWSTVYSSTNTAYSDEEVLKARSWSTAEFWPGVGVKCAFFAYAPYHATGLSAFTTTGWPSFHYMVPTSATAQNDLLVTRNDISTGIGDYGNLDVPGNFNAQDYITFDHACTAIRFAIGEQMAPGTITKIEIQNVYGEGDYQYQTESWTNLSTPSTYSLTKNIPIKATDSNVVLNNNDDVFMMIPQSVPAGATIAVTINDGVEHVLKARIDYDNWIKGYTVTYYISTAKVNTEYVLSLSPSLTSFPSSGGNNVIKINSYKQSYYGSQVAVPWTATYTYDENGNTGTIAYNTTNSAVTAFAASSNGSVSGENVNFSIASSSTSTPAYRSTVENSTHTKTLREVADGSCNLADGKQTANCYVIHAPGHYIFPLVYGNALNGDKTYNTDSYGTPTFVDHKGIQIDNPYIYLTNNSANVPYDVCIVWQDAPHLITPSSLKLSSDNHSIEFDIERDDICQGNSLIAVRDKDGNIMWSWHIWVTDYTLNKTYEIQNNPNDGGAIRSYLMEVPLGYCDAEVRVGGEFRKFHITVKQSENEGSTGSFSTPQTSGDYTYGRNAPYYQWGRKDPLLPSDGINDVNKPYYDNQYITTQTISSSMIKDMTLFPYEYNTSDAYGDYSLELWNKGNKETKNNNNTVYKTIYDPAPSDYIEPKPAAFSGFTISGGWNEGWNFYCQYNSIGETVFCPAMGYRFNGPVTLVRGHGSIWTAGPSGSNTARYLAFNPSAMYTSYPGSSKIYGFTVRPVLK